MEPGDAFAELGLPEPEPVDSRRPVGQYVVVGLATVVTLGFVAWVLLVLVPLVGRGLNWFVLFVAPGDPIS